MDQTFFSSYPLMGIFFMIMEVFKRSIFETFDLLMGDIPMSLLLQKIISTLCIGFLFLICLTLLLCCLLFLLSGHFILCWVLTVNTIAARTAAQR